MSGESARNPIWRVLRIILGSILIPLGVIGLFLPVLQGVLFLILGIALLANDVPFLARIRDRIRARYPGPWLQAERLSERLSIWFRARFGKKRRSGERESSGAPGEPRGPR